MAFKKKNIYEIIGVALVLSALLSTASAVDCLGKSFHCVNSSHFMICVDVGGGVSQSIDDFTIPCPPPTVCQGNNHFECEFRITTTPSTTLSNVISESTMPWEEVDVTTVSPRQNTTKEYSEKYMNTESLTSLSVNSYTTDATVDYTTEATSLIDSVSITETKTVVTETLQYDITTSKDDIAQPITEHNVASAGELLSETANNYTLVQEVTDDAGLVPTSTEKAVPSKLNNTETASLIDDISTTETGPAVTEALPRDTTTSQDIVTQTERIVASAGESLTETTNNYTLVQEETNSTRFILTSTEKAVPSKLNKTETASLIDDISTTETGPAVTEALPHDTTTSQDIVMQTERIVASAGESLRETTNNYTLVQEETNSTEFISTSTEKAIPSKLNNTVTASLIDDISTTETGPAITEALPYDTTTNEDVITQTITKHNAGQLLSETANNYNNTVTTSLVDDISTTETGSAVTDAIPYDTTTNVDVIPQTITEHNKESAGQLLTETAINHTQVQEVITDEGLVSTSTIEAIPSKLNTAEAPSLIDDISTTETNPAVTEALPHDTTTSQDIVTQTESIVVTAGESLTETSNNYTLVQEETHTTGFISTITDKAIPLQLNTTEAASLIDDISTTETNPAVTEALPHNTTTSQDIVTQTERTVASTGESLIETTNNYTLVQEESNSTGFISNSTEKAIPLQLNTTEAASLIDDISTTETNPAVTERIVASAGESLTETTNNYTFVQEETNSTGLISTSTEKAIPLQLNTTEATSLIDDISITETSTAITEALPYDTTTSKDVIMETITDHNTESAGELLTETANNYTLQQVTNNAGLVSSSTEKPVPPKLDTAGAVSLIDGIIITETGPTVTETLPYEMTSSKDVITQTITAAAGGLSTESANTLVQQITTDEGLVPTKTETTKVDIRKTNNVTRGSEFIQVKTTPESIPTEISVVNELPTTSDNVFALDVNLINTDLQVSNTNMLDYRPTTESELATVDSINTADVNLFTTEQPAVADLLQTTLLTNSLNYATTTTESTTVGKVVFNKQNLTVFGKDAVTDTNSISGIEISLVQEQNATHKKPLSTKNISSASSPTEQEIVDMFNNSIFIDVSSILTTETVTDTNANSGNKISLGQEQNTTNNKPLSTKNISSGSSPTEQIIVDMFNSSTSTDVSSISTTETVTDTNANSSIDISFGQEQNGTNNKPLSTKNISSGSSPTEQIIVDMFNNSTTTDVSSISTTETVTDTNANSGSKISLGQEQNTTNNKPLSNKNMSSASSPTEQIIVDMFKNSTSTDVSSISTTETVYLKTNDTWNTTNEEVLDQTKQTSNSMVTEASVFTELPTKGYAIIPGVSTIPSVDLVQNEGNQSMFNYVTLNATKKVEEKIRTEATTNLLADSPLFIKNNLTDNAPVNQMSIDNTGLGSSSTEPVFITTLKTEHNINPDHFARGIEIVTTEETKYNILDQATLIPNIAEQASSTSNINIEENLATSVNDNLTAKKNPIVSVKNLGNSPKFVEYNATEHPKPMIIDKNLFSDTDHITTSSSDSENTINSSLSDHLGKSTEKSAVQHNVSTEKLTIKEIQGSITTETTLETGQSLSDIKNTQKPIPVKDAAEVVSSAQQILDKTSDLDVETGTLQEDAFENNTHPITSFTKQINKVEVADNYHLDLAADGITNEPNYFIHGDTTSAPFIVTTALEAGVESYNKIDDQVSNSEVILDTIRPTDVIYNALNPISNIIFNTNVKQTDVNKVETTTGAIIALTSELIQEKNLNPIGNQATGYIQKVVDSFGLKEKTTESNLKESDMSFHATGVADKPNYGALPINPKYNDSGKTTTIYSHGIKPELTNHKDLFIAEEPKQLNTNLAPTTSFNAKNEATLNYNQFKYLTDLSLSDNTKNKTDLDSHIAAKPEDDLQGIIINTTDNTILKTQEGRTNYSTTTFKTDLSESEKLKNYNTLPSGPKVPDPQYHNPPTETNIGLDVNNYPKFNIVEESFSHVYKSTQIPSQNNYFTTTASIDTNDANIITEKSTPINGVDLNEVSVVNNNIYLPELDTTLQRPGVSSVITDKQISHFNTGYQDDDSLTTKGSTKFASADVKVASKKIGNQAIDLPEKTIGHTEAAATMSSHVTHFATTTVHIRDADKNKIDEVPSVLQTRNSTLKFPQFNDVKNIHQLIGNVFNTALETSARPAFTDVNYNVTKSKSSVQEPVQTTQENTNTNTKASKAWNGNKKGQSLESFLPRQNITINLPTEITTDSFKPYPETSTSRTINAPNTANEDINNALVTGKPMITVLRNKSTDNPLTQPQVVKEIRADVHEINTSSSVIANAEQFHVNVSRKIGTITKTLLSQNHTNPTKDVAKTQRNAKSSHKVINTINSTIQGTVKRVPLRPMPFMTENPTKPVLSSPQYKYNCINGTRGRYSDKNDCRKFYICVGNNQPIVGTCPGNTVFSDIKKLCTRNMSHCIRENNFKCPLAGRFSDLINDVYYICVNHKNRLYRFKLQCQKGFSLNKTITRCMENKVIVPNDSVSISSSNRSESSTASSTSKSSSTSSISSGSKRDSDSSNSSQSRKSEEKKEMEKAEEPEKPDNKEEDESEELFVCRKEGKFPIRNECRRYYLCKKNGKSEYRRKIKKCGSGDVFHKSKKRCVDAESYEC